MFIHYSKLIFTNTQRTIKAIVKRIQKIWYKENSLYEVTFTIFLCCCSSNNFQEYLSAYPFVELLRFCKRQDRKSTILWKFYIIHVKILGISCGGITMAIWHEETNHPLKKINFLFILITKNWRSSQLWDWYFSSILNYKKLLKHWRDTC